MTRLLRNVTRILTAQVDCMMALATTKELLLLSPSCRKHLFFPACPLRVQLLASDRKILLHGRKSREAKISIWAYVILENEFYFEKLGNSHQCTQRGPFWLWFAIFLPPTCVNTVRCFAAAAVCACKSLSRLRRRPPRGGGPL